MTAIPKPIRKTKRSPLKILKSKATHAFQRWIVLRDCDKYALNGMFAPCYTCGKVKHFFDLQGGHYKSGRGNAILFDERGCHAQCKQCNCWPERYDVPTKYKAHMLEEYGQEVVDEFEVLKGQTKDITLEELNDIYFKYDSLLRYVKNLRKSDYK